MMKTNRWLLLLLSFTLLLAAPAQAAFGRQASGLNWKKSSQGMFGGTITALALSPNFAADHVALAGTSEGGMFRSADGGLTWADANAGLWNKQIRAAAFSPAFASDQTVFIGALHAG